MTEISLQRITNGILHEVDLEIGSGEFMVIIGPSGAGKTTLLNVIAGLVHYSGHVTFDCKPVEKVPTYRRALGYVFQDSMLFPHLTVEANLQLAANSTGRNPERSQSAKALLKLLGIEHLRKRLPRHLSAGERQRATLARTLAADPKVLLLDEPFANLDDRSSSVLRAELKSLQKRLGLTTLFVTHNIREAEELGERIALLASGSIEGTFTPDELHRAQNIGNLYECKEKACCQ